MSLPTVLNLALVQDVPKSIGYTEPNPRTVTVCRALVPLADSQRRNNISKDISAADGLAYTYR